MIRCHRQVVHKVVEHVEGHEEELDLHPACVFYAVRTSQITCLSFTAALAATFTWNDVVCGGSCVYETAQFCFVTNIY